MLTLLLLIGCPVGEGKDDTGGGVDSSNDSGSDFEAGSTSCYVDVQFICDELPDGSSEAAENLAISCSSRSGVYAQPAACPAADYQGKCTNGTGTDTTVQEDRTDDRRLRSIGRPSAHFRPYAGVFLTGTPARHSLNEPGT